MNQKKVLVVGTFSAVSLVAAAALAYTYSGQRVTINFYDDAGSANNSGSLVIGQSANRQLGFDDNEIQARAAGGGVSTLYLNHAGGNVRVGDALELGGPYLLVPSSGLGIWTGSTRFMHMNSDRITFDPPMFYANDVEVNTLNVINDALLEGMTTVYGGLLIDSSFRFVAGPLGSGSTLCVGSGNYVGTCSSSRRFKTDIDDLKWGLDEVMAMRPVSFAWKQDGAHDVGFVAEEALAVVPELVEQKDGVVQGFNYRHYTAVLTRAIQEQQHALERSKHALARCDRETTQLQGEVAEQARELRSLREQVAQLATAVTRLAAITAPGQKTAMAGGLK